MAIKLNPKQTKTIIDGLNKEYKNDVKTTKIETSDFYEGDSNRELKSPDLFPKLLEKLKTEAPAASKDQKALPAPEGEQKDLFQEKGVATKSNAYAVIQQLRPIMGEEKLERFLKNFMSYELQNKPDKAAFLTLEGPTEKEISVDLTIWKHDILPGFEKWEEQYPQRAGMDSATKILKDMAATERNAILKKLDFPCKFKQYSDKSGWTLATKVPVKKVYYNVKFNSEKFLKAADTRLDRQDKVIDQEELVEKLTQFFDHIGQAESDYMETEEYMDSYSEYSEEDAKGKDLKDMKRELDSELETYIDRMETLGIEEDTIKELLIECADNEFNGGRDNRIGWFSLGDDYENQVDFGGYNDERYEEDMATFKLPYKELTANLALLTEEGAKQLKRDVSNIYIDPRWDDATDGYNIDHGTVTGGGGNSWDMIVDPDKFMLLAKRLIKDAKLAKRDERRGAAASVEYPAVRAMLAQEPDLDSYPLITALLKKAGS